MPEKPESLVACEDLQFAGPGRRHVTIDLTAETVTFENCHCPRGFLSSGYEPIRVCPFGDLLAAHDFLGGKHRGSVVRSILLLGKLTGGSTNSGDLASIFISTTGGRCRVFANWAGFEEFRDTIQAICEGSPRGHWSDDPRLMPLYVAAIFAVVGGIIWWLL